MNRLCHFLAAPPVGFSASAHRSALRRMAVLAALAAAVGALPLLAPRPAQSSELSVRPAPPRAPEQRQARRKTMMATVVAAPAEPRS